MKVFKKNVFLLVLPIEEISLQPELSISARLGIHGGGLSLTEVKGMVHMIDM